MKNILRRLAVLFCLMLALALPAFAEGEKGEANITPQTTMKELRENPSIKGSGIYTYVYVWERDCGLLKSSKDNDTMLDVIGKESVNSCVAGMNFLTLYAGRNCRGQDARPCRTLLFPGR